MRPLRRRLPQGAAAPRRWHRPGAGVCWPHLFPRALRPLPAAHPTLLAVSPPQGAKKPLPPRGAQRPKNNEPGRKQQRRAATRARHGKWGGRGGWPMPPRPPHGSERAVHRSCATPASSPDVSRFPNQPRPPLWPLPDLPPPTAASLVAAPCQSIGHARPHVQWGAPLAGGPPVAPGGGGCRPDCPPPPVPLEPDKSSWLGDPAALWGDTLPHHLCLSKPVGGEGGRTRWVPASPPIPHPLPPLEKMGASLGIRTAPLTYGRQRMTRAARAWPRKTGSKYEIGWVAQSPAAAVRPTPGWGPRPPPFWACASRPFFGWRAGRSRVRARQRRPISVVHTHPA